MQEEWRDVVGYEGLYQVSNIGRVKSVRNATNSKTELLIKATPRGNYLGLTLCKNNTTHSFLVHRLVAIAFIPNLQKKPCVDHIDGNPYNNRADNLRWSTHKENNNNPVTLARHKQNPSKPWLGKTGILHKCSIPVICIETGQLFYGLGDAERETGVHHGNICAVLKGRLKTAGGYHWRYATPEEIAQAKNQ